MSKVLLLHAEDKYTRGFVGAMPPLGLAYLATALEREGLSVAILDRQIDTRLFEDVFDSQQPEILGISCTTATRFEAFRYAAEAKRRRPGTLVVLGGSHATCTAEDTLRHLPQFDVIVRGEGELSFSAVARRFLSGSRDFSGIPGVSFRHDGRLIHSPPAERVFDLDTIGFPARHLLPNDLYKLENEFIGGRSYHVMASRGCPYQCTFCSAAEIWGRRITYRSPQHVVNEMVHLRDKFGAEGFRFMDALITQRRKYIHDLCTEIVRRDVVLPWEAEVRADTIDEEILDWMRKAGCYYIDIGAESINPAVLKRMRKQITPEQITGVLQLAHKMGIKTKVFFTFGHIGETFDQALETLAFMRKNRRYVCRIGGSIGINIFPGTEVEKYARTIGSLPEDFSWSLPYEDKRNLVFSTSPSVPILIQPQLGWREMYSLRRRHLFQKMKDPTILAANFKRLKDPIAFRRLARIFTGVWRRSRARTN
ncbi:MAG: B12-binding domain-containing radical SAM protein [bacterium]|nr:MAG: B12-binding domain-containing radical SAM protein [bacterium]